MSLSRCKLISPNHRDKPVIKVILLHYEHHFVRYNKFFDLIISVRMDLDADSGFGLDTIETIDNYIDGIRQGRRTIIDQIYRRYFPKIRNLVLRNSGNGEDARDVFQDALIAVYRNVQRPGFVLTCQFETYLYAIARNLWFATLRKRNIKYTDNEILLEEEQQISDLEETVKEAALYQVYVKTFNSLGEQCRKLLTLYMQGALMKNIAAQLGFASESYARKRKFQCKQKLIDQVTGDSDYKRIIADE